MKTTIDGAGRIVIPKILRDAVGLAAGAEIDVAEDGGRLVITSIGPRTRIVERAGRPVVTVEGTVAPLTSDAVRELIERGRR